MYVKLYGISAYKRDHHIQVNFTIYEDIRHTASYLVTKGTRAPTRGSVDPSDESFFIEHCLYSSSLPL